MSLKLLVVVCIILSYAGVHVLFKKGTISLLVGMEFLLLGFLLSLLNVDTGVAQPFLYTLLGWIGLLTGTQFEVKYLLQLEKGFFSTVILYCLLVISATALLLLPLGVNILSAFGIAVALISVSYPTVARHLGSNRYVLFFVSTLPFWTVFALFGLYIVSASPEKAILSCAFIVGFSILSRFIIAVNADARSVNLLLMGLTIFISESCAVSGISPLVVCFFIGAYIANFCSIKDAVFTNLYAAEKQLYMLFLTLTGMTCGFTLTPRIIVMSLAVVGASLAVKYAVVKVPFFKLSRYKVTLFLAPGGFALAVGIDTWLMKGGAEKSPLFISFCLAVIVLQFIAVYSSRVRNA